MEQSKMKEIVYLSLGSNIGNRAENIVLALSLLQSSMHVNIINISSFYDTLAMGPRQRRFYNIVIKARTNLNPRNLLLLAKQVEQILGRKKTKKWGARIIDIDILFFGKEIIIRNYLVIPHKEIEKRLFVLIPLNEIEGNYIHPVSKRKISDILSCRERKTKGNNKEKMCNRIVI